MAVLMSVKITPSFCNVSGREGLSVFDSNWYRLIADFKSSLSRTCLISDSLGSGGGVATDSKSSPPRSAYFVYNVESSIGSSLKSFSDFVLNSRNHVGSFREFEIIRICSSAVCDVTSSGINRRAGVEAGAGGKLMGEF